MATGFRKIRTPAHGRTLIVACLLAGARTVYSKSRSVQFAIKGKTFAYCDQLELIFYEINNTILALDKNSTTCLLLIAEQYLVLLQRYSVNY